MPYNCNKSIRGFANTAKTATTAINAKIIPINPPRFLKFISIKSLFSIL